MDKQQELTKKVFNAINDTFRKENMTIEEGINALTSAVLKILYGCAALKSFVADKAGEIYCLAVSDKGRGMGYGDLLLQSIENMAVKQGLTQLFALTTRTADWFLERGFEASDLNALPAIRRKQYIENKRNSKIFVKQPKSSPFQAA
jgi:N-acetylglutamate synthase-like GNAT family acetyltransferase